MSGAFDAVARQAEIYLGPLRGRRARIPVAFDALEAAARRKIPRRAFDYLAGGAGFENSILENRRAFDRYRVVPRVLRDVSTRDLSVELLGSRLPAPILLGPVGVLETAHREADVAAARAAARLGVPFVFSSQASRSMEQCAAAMGDSPRWFQLYWSRIDSVAESFRRRAEGCGCSAVVLTLDTTLLGWRVRDLSHPYLPFLEGRGIAQYTSDPAFLDALTAGLDPESESATAAEEDRLTAAALRTLVSGARNVGGGFITNLRTGRSRRAVARFIATYSRPSIAWADLGQLRSMTSLPILLKGILHPEDARRAVESGVDGIIVSNHGGRQIDGEIAALDALPGVVAAVREASSGTGRPFPVLFDSGVRSGADIFKAVALGAAAVCIGRPYAYALAVAGSDGVAELVCNLASELELTMALSGITRVADIGPKALVPTGRFSAADRV